MLLVHDGVFVTSRPGNVSLFWSYLMGIFPVSDVVKVVPVSSAQHFLVICQDTSVTLVEHFCVSCRRFMLNSGCVRCLGSPSRGEMFPVTCARPVLIRLTATVRSCEGHSDQGHGSPLKLFVKILLI